MKKEINKNKSLNTAKVLTVLFLACMFTVGAAQVSAQSWSAPISSPPAGNTYAPLNVGSSVQLKDSGLILNAATPGSAYGLVVPYGMVNIGSGSGSVNNGTNKVQIAGDINLTGTSPCYRVNGTCLTGSGGLASGTVSQTLRSDGTNWVASSNLLNTGTAVGVGGITPATGATLHVANTVGGNGTIRVSRPDGGYSTLQLYKQNGGNWHGWAFVNDPNNDFRLNYDTANNSSGGSALLYAQSGGYQNLGLGTAEGQYFDAKSKLMVGGKILLDLRAPTYVAANPSGAYRDGLEMIVGGSNTAGRFIVNKPSFEFWNNSVNGSTGARAGLLASQIELAGNGSSDIPAVGKVLTAVNSIGAGEWKNIGSAGAETTAANTGARADCPLGQVVTGISYSGANVTGVICKSLGAL